MDAKFREYLFKLKDIMIECASNETAYDFYDPSISRLDGHCGAVAHVVHSLLGGRLVGAKISGERHIWNMLPDGTEIDLSSCQYGNDPCCLKRVANGTILPIKKGVNKKHRIFEMKVRKLLDN